MSGKHSKTIRGLTNKGVDFHGTSRFGRLFYGLPAGKYGDTDADQFGNLSKLAKEMVSEFDAPKDGQDAEESGIPALYTYLGQFVDHDLTFDPDASFQKQKDPDATEDFRTAALDLDNIYGRGPGDQPYLYDDAGRKFLFGDPLTLGAKDAHDLQRNAAGRALIGDPRNDENTIVSQLQGLFLRFHNRVIDDHPEFADASNSDLYFQRAQQFVRHHYQYMVFNDFLPRIVSASVLDTLKTNGRYDLTKLRIFKVGHHPKMPVEFSVAAYRLGHSMVRPGYRLNDANLIAIFPIFPDPPTQPNVRFPEGLTGFRKLVSNWGIDWGRFIDIDIRKYQGPDRKCGDDCVDKGIENFNRLQFAYRIDTAIVFPLGGLPQVVAPSAPPPSRNAPSLALRNLLRGLQFGLPTGQEAAKALGLVPLPDDKILIGQGVDGATLPNIVEQCGPVFAGNCPLWTYILAEAIQNQIPVKIPVVEDMTVSTPQMGPVGGRIVAEVLLGLAFSDPGSYLTQDPFWTPKNNAGFALKDFVNYALGNTAVQL